jgi:hypothetical protein
VREQARCTTQWRSPTDEPTVTSDAAAHEESAKKTWKKTRKIEASELHYIRRCSSRDPAILPVTVFDLEVQEMRYIVLRRRCRSGEFRWLVRGYHLTWSSIEPKPFAHTDRRTMSKVQETVLSSMTVPANVDCGAFSSPTPCLHSGFTSGGSFLGQRLAFVLP